MDNSDQTINRPSSCQTAGNTADNKEAASAVAGSFADKVREQMALTIKLVALLPNDKLEWRPVANAFCVCDLLGHLLDCFAGFCAALRVVRPAELAHFAALRDLPVNHCCGGAEAERRLEEYRTCIEEGLALLTDKDLTKVIPTVFTTSGETAMTVLLGNIEHLINHKYQLFFYLKLLGVAVESRHLYRFRDE